jgi:hypothetical protein
MLDLWTNKFGGTHVHFDGLTHSKKEGGAESPNQLLSSDVQLVSNNEMNHLAVPSFADGHSQTKPARF